MIVEGGTVEGTLLGTDTMTAEEYAAETPTAGGKEQEGSRLLPLFIYTNCFCMYSLNLRRGHRPRDARCYHPYRRESRR